MPINDEPYPWIEIGRTLPDDRVVVQRDDLVVALTCVRALSYGFMFRLSIIAAHELDPPAFDLPPDARRIALTLKQTDTTGITTVKKLQLQGGGGSGSRYEYDFWAPVDNTAACATIWVRWPAERLPPTSVQFELRNIRAAAVNVLATTGTFALNAACPTAWAS